MINCLDAEKIAAVWTKEEGAESGGLNLVYHLILELRMVKKKEICVVGWELWETWATHDL